jgi:hypothetical protein
MEIHTIGIDLGKTVFHLVGLDARGEVVVRKKCSRNQILRFTANLRVGLIGMESCGGSHFSCSARCGGQQRDAIQTEAPAGVNSGRGLCWCFVRGVAPAVHYFFSDILVAT